MQEGVKPTNNLSVTTSADGPRSRPTIGIGGARVCTTYGEMRSNRNLKRWRRDLKKQARVQVRKNERNGIQGHAQDKLRTSDYAI
jgi:hypothetical protein